MEVRIIRSAEQYARQIEAMNETRMRGCVHCGSIDRLDIYQNHLKEELVLDCSCLNCGNTLRGGLWKRKYNGFPKYRYCGGAIAFIGCKIAFLPAFSWWG